MPEHQNDDNRRIDGLKLGRSSQARRIFELKRLKPYLFACGVVLAAALVAEGLYEFLHFTRVSGIFLVAILVVAARHGPLPALWSASLAFLAYVFFTVEPRFSLRIDTNNEVINLVVFMMVALITGRLAGKLQNEGEQARARARRFAILFDASRELSALAQEDAIRCRLAVEVSKAVRGQAEVIWGGRTWASLVGRGDEAVAVAWTTRELGVAGRHLGVCRWRAARSDGLGRRGEDLVEIIVDLGAAALARVAPLDDPSQPTGPRVRRSPERTPRRAEHRALDSVSNRSA